MRSRAVIAAAALLLGVPGASIVHAQQPAAVFDRLEGEWVGTGSLMGRNAQFTMSWMRRGIFAVLDFTNAFVDSSGRTTPVLHAAALYRTSTTTAEAVWLDSRGVRIEIHWSATDSTLVASWTAPTETGRTTYRVISAEQLEVVDEVMRGDTMRPFAMARYRRRSPGAPS